ncbi:MAG: hypothetical protein LUG85_05780 [Clostridiales bacterium]|nr:hypothetical protein [Clostridiales bacterium]
MSTENEKEQGVTSSKEGMGAIPESLKNEFLKSSSLRRRKNTSASVENTAEQTSVTDGQAPLADKEDADKNNAAVEKVELFDAPAQEKKADERLFDGGDGDSFSKKFTESAPKNKTEKKRKASDIDAPKDKTEPVKKDKDGKKKKEPERSNKNAAAKTDSRSINIKPIMSSVLVTMIISSVILFFFPMLSFSGSSSKIAVSTLVVSLFYIFLIYSYAALLVIKLIKKKEIDKMYSGKSAGMRIYRFFGIVNFFRNKAAAAADIVFIVFAVLTIILIAAQTTSTVLMCIAIGILLLSFNLHIYFNDSIYEYIISNRDKKKGVNTNEEKL